MINMALLQCPKCFKVYITKIVLRQTLTGGRPTLIYPYDKCNGQVDEETECGFPFTSLQVESFDIPISVNSDALVTKPSGGLIK